MISHQEHEAWDVLLTCQGQLRLAPSGQVIGIDMDASLRLAAARRHDLAVLSELLPAAEAGMIEALSTDRARDSGLLISGSNVALLPRHSRPRGRFTPPAFASAPG